MFWNKKPIDFLAIGDITIDAFIRLQDASVHCNIRHEDCELCVRYGDKIPYEFASVIPAVGNSPNAAVSAAKLGVSSAVIASVGNDENGALCKKTLAKHGVSENYLITDPELPTNYHYVLWYEAERTILVHQNAFTYHMPKSLPKVSWIYLSSLGKSSLDFHKELLSWLELHPETKLAFQPGTFQMSLDKELFTAICKRTEVFILNKEEAERVLSLSSTTNIHELITGLHTLGAKLVVITDGPKGLYASTGATSYFLPVYPDIAPPYERTGAGDATASTIVAMMATGMSFEEALRYGPVNSMSVVQKVGAQEGLLTRREIESYLAQAPEDYKLTTI